MMSARAGQSRDGSYRIAAPRLHLPARYFQRDLDRRPAGFRRSLQPKTCVSLTALLSCSFCLLVSPAVARADTQAADPYPPKIQKIFATYCYDCHGEGMEKGKVAFDELTSHAEMVSKRDLFFTALKNVRAGIMPPEKKPRPDAQEQLALANWIKSDIFQIDNQNIDPGKVTFRRLNRIEYRNT